MEPKSLFFFFKWQSIIKLYDTPFYFNFLYCFIILNNLFARTKLGVDTYDGAWPSRISPRSDLALFKPCDGVWPSRLSLRSDLTPFSNHVMVCDTLGSVQGPTSPFSNHVMVYDLFGSIRSLTSPFSNPCEGSWPSQLGPRSDLTLFKSCDGKWPSRLSPRSNLILFQIIWWCVTLSA